MRLLVRVILRDLFVRIGHRELEVRVMRGLERIHPAFLPWQHPLFLVCRSTVVLCIHLANLEFVIVTYFLPP